MKRQLGTAAVIGALLWAVSGVSVLALVLHEHHHHSDPHHHHDAVQVALHGHAHDGYPDHDHELTAPLSASRTFWTGHFHAPISQAFGFVESVVCWAGDSALHQFQFFDLGPPPYLVHCVFLT